MTFPMQFSDAFINQRFGTITGTSAESQFPNVPAHIGLLRARSGNTSPMYLGSGNTGSAFQLGAGEWTPWFSRLKFLKIGMKYLI